MGQLVAIIKVNRISADSGGREKDVCNPEDPPECCFLLSCVEVELTEYLTRPIKGDG